MPIIILSVGECTSVSDLWKKIIAYHEDPTQVQGVEEPKEKGSLVQEEKDQTDVNLRSTSEEEEEEKMQSDVDKRSTFEEEKE